MHNRSRLLQKINKKKQHTLRFWKKHSDCAPMYKAESDGEFDINMIENLWDELALRLWARLSHLTLEPYNTIALLEECSKFPIKFLLFQTFWKAFTKQLKLDKDHIKHCGKRMGSKLQISIWLDKMVRRTVYQSRFCVYNRFYRSNFHSRWCYNRRKSFSLCVYQNAVADVGWILVQTVLNKCFGIFLMDLNRFLMDFFGHYFESKCPTLANVANITSIK